MFLKPARREFAVRPPLNWDGLEHGDWWYSSLMAWLHEQDPIVFGQYMITLGQFDIPWPDCRVKEQYRVAPHSKPAQEQLSVQAAWTELPFALETVDWVTLPFVLEYVDDPHRVLREADRMLRPDGHMLIVSNNPYGLHNIIRMLPGKSKRTPWNSRLFTSARVSDWLGLLNYEVIHQGYFGAGCPWPSVEHKAVKDSMFYEKLPLLRAGYALIVRKREWPVTWDRLKAKERKRSSRSEMLPVGRQATRKNISNP